MHINLHGQQWQQCIKITSNILVQNVKRRSARFNEERDRHSIKKDKKLMTKCYPRILQKIKNLYKGFSKTVISGKHSGSGKNYLWVIPEIKTIVV